MNGNKEIHSVFLQDDAILEDLINSIAQNGLTAEQSEIVTGKTSGTSALLMSDGKVGLIPGSKEIKSKTWNPFLVKFPGLKSLYYKSSVSVLSMSKYQKAIGDKSYNMQDIKITYDVNISRSFQPLSLLISFVILSIISAITQLDLGGGGLFSIAIIVIAFIVVYQIVKAIRNILTPGKMANIKAMYDKIDKAIATFETRAVPK